ncbi:aldo/keto reductase [Streptomyces sp. NPDC059003]|uniref:aldo/keto reductase n=1 Tax=Streptomyces sp. NPDC059003 TaxID=3346691 RepID=UPI00368C6922
MGVLVSFSSRPPGIHPTTHRRSGRSGLRLSALGLNLGNGLSPDRPDPVTDHALDLGITHFDISSRTGTHHLPEKGIGCLLPWHGRRDEMVISLRSGPATGPLAGFGSRKQILSGLDSTLRRTGLTYVDILYAHRLDPETPLEESMGALAAAVQQGKALYTGLSAFPLSAVRPAAKLLSQSGTPCTVYQGSYSLLDRRAEKGLLDVLHNLGIGFVAGAPLAQGRLSTARRQEQQPYPDTHPALPGLEHIAAGRRQSLDQLALSWCLRAPTVTSALVTTSRLDHLLSAHQTVHHARLSPAELAALDACCPPVQPTEPRAGACKAFGVTGGVVESDVGC